MPRVDCLDSESRSCSWRQFTTSRVYEDLSATQNARTVTRAVTAKTQCNLRGSAKFCDECLLAFGYQNGRSGHGGHGGHGEVGKTGLRMGLKSEILNKSCLHRFFSKPHCSWHKGFAMMHSRRAHCSRSSACSMEAHFIVRIVLGFR